MVTMIEFKKFSHFLNDPVFVDQIKRRLFFLFFTIENESLNVEELRRVFG